MRKSGILGLCHEKKGFCVEIHVINEDINEYINEDINENINEDINEDIGDKSS